MKYAAALVLFMKGNFSSRDDGIEGGAYPVFRRLPWHFIVWPWRTTWWFRETSAKDKPICCMELLLRDPSELEWRMDPMEAIAFLAYDHVGAMERWFDIVVNRKDMDRAINIAELVRRHRFFARLPLGGRLMAFRWVLHAPEKALTNNALEQRQSFLTRNPQYLQLMDRAEQIRTQLLALPIQPESGSDEARQQNATL